MPDTHLEETIFIGTRLGIKWGMRSYFAPAILVLLTLASASAIGQASGSTVRARDLGVPFDGAPGPLNAITDVAGVEVGITTLIRGEGALKVGEGPVRTGVTVVLPRGAKNTRSE